MTKAFNLKCKTKKT